MQKFNIEITRTIELTVHEEGEAFKKALSSFREVINHTADEDDMILYVATEVLKHGADHMIEGVGYVRMNHHCKDESMYCGIDVEDDDPFVNAEIV